ncbi:PX domain containing protein [Klebsormidium nitens]|uniref:PX domain containing protein n=1 Tax=Klebsormidium nitens TaxID=105231 RepID=A0A0U9HJS2_KLENI|nr:PX domain containing protein [Klebsormidium nitens]|eukprot:GAQ83243.1 PX domain containing protein [Klebsormidium nitens]
MAPGADASGRYDLLCLSSTGPDLAGDMRPAFKGARGPSHPILAQEHIMRAKMTFERMTRFMSFRNVRVWEDLHQEISQRTLAVVLAGIALAYGLSLTSASMWANLPVAFVILLLLRRLSFNYEIRWSPDYHPDCCIHNQWPVVHQLAPDGPLLSFDLQKHPKRLGNWKVGINAPAVEAAVDALTKAIVKEWVTNLWYRLVTPDEDFPEELRLLLNRAIAEIAVRIRKANLVNLLTRDLVNLFGHHLELYRRARDHVGRDVLDRLSASEQDERLRQAMLRLGALHVALTSAPAEYRVLRRLMGGVVTSALRSDEVQCRLVRVIAREILASAVMRPLMSLFTPALINDLILSSIPDPKKPAKEGETAPPESEASSRRPSGVHEEGGVAEHKPVPPPAPSFGAEDLAKFEKRKTALAAEHWDQMWVGAKGKRQRALAEERERRAREAAALGGVTSSAGEGVGERGSKWGDMSPLASSTTSLNTFEGEEASPPGRAESVPGVVSDLLLDSQSPSEPVVPGIGWESDGWEDPVSTPTAPGATAGVAASAPELGGVTRALEVRVSSELGAASSRLPKKETTDRSSARKSVGLAKLDANWMGLDAPHREGTASAPKTPLLSTRSEGVVFAANLPPLSTRSENGDRTWEKRGASSSWNEALEDPPARRHRRSLSGGFESLATDEAWGDVDADVSKARRRGSFEEPPRGGLLRRTSSERLWEVAGESAPVSPDASGVLPAGGWNRVLGRVVGAKMEESGGKAFAVYTIAVADSDRSSWLVQRRYRNFEALHRRLKDLPQYKLKLPPKRFLGPNLDGSFVLERRAQLDKYLQDLLAVPSVAESHEVWDFLSADSHAYGYGHSSSMIKTLAGNVDDVVDTMFRRLNEVSDELQGALTKGLKKAPTLNDTLSKQKTLPKQPGLVEVAMADQAYRGGGVDDAFVEVREFDDGAGGYNRQAAKGGGSGRAANRDGLLSVQPDTPASEGGGTRDGLRSQSSVDSGFSVDSAQPRRGDAPGKNVRRDAPTIVEEREGSASATGEESEDDEEGIPLPQEWHASKLSGPLLNLVDNVFKLQQYGWLRRQVVWMARQILEIGLGDAIDDFILTQIQWIRQPEVVAAAVDGVRSLLWPSGIWFANQPESATWQQPPVKKPTDARQPEVVRPAKAAAEHVRAAAKESDPSRHVHKGAGNGRADAGGVKTPSVNSEGEIEWDWHPRRPQLSFEERLEAARKAALVREIFLDRAPAALVSLIGSKQYKKCARDVYNFIQSPICVKQLAYGVLELLIEATFPELQALVQDVRTNGASR